MAPAPERRPDLEDYRSLGVLAFPVGGTQELVYSESSGAARVLPTADVDLLMGCDAFRTLDGHARETCRRWNLPPDRMGPMLYQLAQFAKAGLLVSRQELLERCRSRAEERGRISTVALLTGDRPASVEGLLAGLLERADRERVFLVLDGSDANASVRPSAAALRERFGLVVRYAGAEERARHRAAIVEEGGFDPELVEFAIGGAAPGGRRNAFLLAVAGELALALDDGGELGVARPPEQDGRTLAVSSEEDPTVVRAYPDREAARRAAVSAAEDLVALHEAWLGRDPSALAAAAEAGGLDLDAMDARFLRLLWGGGGRVRLTQPGGCAAAAGARAPSAFRLPASEPAGRSGRAHERLRSVVRATLGNRPFFPAFGAGFDHRETLPPFLPVGPLDGSIFAGALLKSSGRACIGHLPWVMFRDAKEAEPEAGRILFREVVSACLASFEPGRAMPEGRERLAAMGGHLEGLGALPRPEFEEIVRNLHWFATGRRIERLEALAEEARESAPEWADELRKSVAELRKALPREDYLAPGDLSENRSASEARDLSQRLVLRFGRLLREWPDLAEAARELRRKERFLGSPA